MLLRAASSSRSLEIVPSHYGNISRFFSEINNEKVRKGFSKRENIQAIKFAYQGRVRVLFYAKKPIQADEKLYFNYNGSAFQEYPTEHFVE